MKTAELSANVREESGKGSSHRLRKNHKVPGIMYGRELGNIMVEFSEMDLNDAIKSYGEHAIVNVDVNGEKIKTMIKEIQRDPVSRRVDHVDMKYIKDDEKVHADIPIVIRGESAVKSKGGVVQKQMGNITVETLPENLPKFVTADVSALNIGQKLMVSDIELSSDITLINDIHAIVASITGLSENESNLDSGEQQALDSSSEQK
jgi:ribosomal protein L25, Ctc-form